MIPKVLVGCPTSDLYEYCIDDYISAVKSLTYKNYDILLVDNSKTDKFSNKLKSLGINVIRDSYKDSAKERIISSRNILRQYVLSNNYDYLLSLEQDVIPQQDIIEKLLRHNKKVITGIYFSTQEIDGKRFIAPLVWKFLDKNSSKLRYLNSSELANSSLLEIASSGLGCILIHRTLLEKIKFRYDNESFDDRLFSYDLYLNKIKMYADNTILCKHLINKRPWTWDDIEK